jgi:hypothetical protein
MLFFCTGVQMSLYRGTNVFVPGYKCLCTVVQMSLYRGTNEFLPGRGTNVFVPARGYKCVFSVAYKCVVSKHVFFHRA